MTARDLHTLLAHAAGADPRSDADLVAHARDPAAFAGLVRRHGPLVWTTARRMLPDPADAADAFQAVFLALARSADRLRTPAAVGGWLHAATVRVCLKQRRTLARRRQRERRVARPEADAPVADVAWDALLAAVHEEIDRLPDGERLAFVVCELQGVPAGEAATRLGWKPGTLTGRLSKARAKLLTKLSARGLAPAVGFAGVGTLAVPAEVLATAGRPASAAVLALSTEVTAMVTTKHLAAAVLVTAGLLAGVGGGLLTPVAGQYVPNGFPPPKVQDTKWPPATDPLDPNSVVTERLPSDPLPAAAVPAASHARWEYDYQVQPARRKEFTDLVTNRGQAGWEYAGVVQVSDGVPMVGRGGGGGAGMAGGPPDMNGTAGGDDGGAGAGSPGRGGMAGRVGGPEKIVNLIVFKRPAGGSAVPSGPVPPRAAVNPPGSGNPFSGPGHDPDRAWEFVSNGQPTVNLNDPTKAAFKDHLQREGVNLPLDGTLTKQMFTDYLRSRYPAAAAEPMVQTYYFGAGADGVARRLGELVRANPAVGKAVRVTSAGDTQVLVYGTDLDRPLLADLLRKALAPPVPPALPTAMPPAPGTAPSVALVGVMADALAEQPLGTFEEAYARVKAANPGLRLTDKIADVDPLKSAVAARLARDRSASAAVWRVIGGVQKKKDGDSVVQDRVTVGDLPNGKAVAAAVERWGLVLSPGGQITHKQFEEMWQVRPLGLEAPRGSRSRNPLADQNRPDRE